MLYKISIFLLLFSLNSFATPKLREGVKAPQLTVTHWLRGQPVNEFEPGRIYIVEFWAKWCGPCVASIPHLNELAEQYRHQVTVIGINVEAFGSREPQDTLPIVQEFLEQNDPPMHYTVGVDSDGSNEQDWLNAAFQRGIPSSFVVDRDGKIAFIGHPMNLDSEDLGNPIRQIVAGTWTKSEIAKKIKRERLEKIRQDQNALKLANGLTQARESRNWNRFYKLTQDAKRLCPDHSDEFVLPEAEVLITHLGRADEGFSLLSTYIKRGLDVYALGEVLNLVVQEDVRAVRYEKALAQRIVRRMLRQTKTREIYNDWLWWFLPPVANYYFATRQFQKAIDLQKRLIANVEGTTYAEGALPRLRAELAKFEGARRPAGGPKDLNPSQLSEPICHDGVCELPTPPPAPDCEDDLS